MKIEKLTLKNYRNYDDLNLNFNKNLNIIIGNNAQGKTNLLESIYLLSVTKTFLSLQDKNLIKFGEKVLSAKGNIVTKEDNKKLEIIINDKGKNVKINNKKINKLSEYISNFNVVIFCSDSIRIFKDTPTARRKYFNIQISQINRNYLKLLNDYNNILKQRNEFLKIININKQNDLLYLDILNEKYVDYSLKIFNYRKEYIENINSYLDIEFKKITDLTGLKLKYISNIENLNRDQLLLKLKNNLNKEIQYKMTLIGPNRDDYYFEYNSKNLLLYGSQGQIRCLILALKLSEVQLFTKIKGDSPILLLDDIFSELDIKKRNNILNNIDPNIQVVITTTDIENINEDIRKKADVYKIENGKIISREIILEQEGEENE